MKITDKMIDDFNNCILKTIDRETNKPVAVLDKYLLKQKGYEVEEEKTATEEVRFDFTDGEWEVSGAYRHLISLKSGDDYKSTIGEMWQRPFGSRKDNDKEMQANARLMSCAPEMLYIIFRLVRYYSNEKRPEAIFKLDHAKEIIEKATGKKWEDIK